MVLEGIIHSVVSVSITRSIPLLLVEYQSSRVSSVQQSLFLSLGRYLFCWWNISPRGYHPPSSQCFSHQVDTSSAGRLLVLDNIIRPVVSVSITRSIPLLLVEYWSSRVSSVQQSCFYHQVDTSSAGGILVLGGIIRPVVRVSITRSIPLLLVEYWSSRVSSAQQSVFLSLGRYLFCWWNIGPRGYHRPVVSVSITRSIPLLLVDYQSSIISSVQQSVFLSLGRYLFCWWNIGPRGYHPPSSQCFYHQVDTSSAGGILVLEGIISQVVSVSITRSIPLLLVEYWSSRVSSAQQSVFLSLGRYLFCWWNIGLRGYHPPSSQCFYLQVDTSSAGGILVLEGIIAQQSVFLSLGRYLFCWWNIGPRGYHPPSSQCFYHQVDTSSAGRRFVLEGIIRSVVSVSITRSILPLLADYQTSIISSVQQSVFLSLGRYFFCWWNIGPRGYHPPSSQCFYHQVDTSSAGRLFVLEGIIRSVVSVSITRSILPLLADYQTSIISSVQQSVFLSLGRCFFCWWNIGPRGYHPLSSQCFNHQIDTSSASGILVLEGIIRPVVSVSITRSIPLLLVEYQSSRVSSAQQSVFLSLGRYLFCWQSTSPR